MAGEAVPVYAGMRTRVVHRQPDGGAGGPSSPLQSQKAGCADLIWWCLCLSTPKQWQWLSLYGSMVGRQSACSKCSRAPSAVFQSQFEHRHALVYLQSPSLCNLVYMAGGMEVFCRVTEMDPHSIIYRYSSPWQRGSGGVCRPKIV